MNKKCSGTNHTKSTQGMRTNPTARQTLHQQMDMEMDEKPTFPCPEPFKSEQFHPPHLLRFKIITPTFLTSVVQEPNIRGGKSAPTTDKPVGMTHPLHQPNDPTSSTSVWSNPRPSYSFCWRLPFLLDKKY
jgi:hypothetical protein